MPRETTKQAATRRRSVARHRGPSARSTWAALARNPAFGPGVITVAAFFMLAAGLLHFSRNTVQVAPDRLSTRTITARTPFEVVDENATRRARDLARNRADRVYIANEDVFEELRASLTNLPASLGAVDSPEEVEPSIREQFGITSPDDLALIRSQLDTSGDIRSSWRDAVIRLLAQLEQRPILSSDAYQLQLQSAGAWMTLMRLAGVERTPEPLGRVRRDAVLDAASDRLTDALEPIVEDAGFTGRLRDLVLARLTAQPLVTFRLDESATATKAAAEAEAVAPSLVQFNAGDVLVSRGERVQPQKLELLRAERLAFLDAGGYPERAARLVGPIAVAAATTAGLVAYIVLFCPRIARNPTRSAATAAFMLVALLAAVATATAQPGFVALAVTAPTAFVAIILVIAYDQRTALALSTFHATLVASALIQPVGVYAVAVLGAVTAVATLKEIRERNTLIRTGVFLAAVLGAAATAAAFLNLPASADAVKQAFWDGTYAAGGGVLVAMIAVFVLPLIERGFGITTGMTLIELRDPKRDLLRLLQQRAPGTYNHSLNVASLGEAAADAIGADALLTYVGALYHDVGKLNKPEYFVENQTPGFNRHSKLNPAMSVLIIVGHVKDGIELAREYNLPKPLRHFIEAHHGTTLVEYFYHRAVEAAEDKKGDGQAELPNEFEYRYPGPKPQTKEVAIIMLCDAVESAARAMADPSPSRIEQTVRAIANKRLMDGQFDECNLTLRELNTIVEAVSKTLASIYHGRIAYPTTERARAARAAASEAQQPANPAPQTATPAVRPQAAPAHRQDTPGLGAP